MGKATLLLFLTLQGFLAFVVADNKGKASVRSTDLGPVDYQCPPGVYVTAHETQCELYYLCGEGTPTHLYRCDDGQLFSHRFDGCDFAELVDCGTRLPPFQCPSSNGDYPIYSGACDSRYYTCTNGNSIIKTCPNGGIFNEATGTCAAPGAITCATTTTPRLPTSPGPYTCPAGANGNYPSPYNCYQFYQCIDGVAFLFECPSGLYYDRDRDTCDYPENVTNCKAKSIFKH